MIRSIAYEKKVAVTCSAHTHKECIYTHNILQLIQHKLFRLLDAALFAFKVPRDVTCLLCVMILDDFEGRIELSAPFPLVILAIIINPCAATVHLWRGGLFLGPLLGQRLGLAAVVDYHALLAAELAVDGAVGADDFTMVLAWDLDRTSGTYLGLYCRDEMEIEEKKKEN